MGPTDECGMYAVIHTMICAFVVCFCCLLMNWSSWSLTGRLCILALRKLERLSENMSFTFRKIKKRSRKRNLDKVVAKASKKESSLMSSSHRMR